MKPPPHLRTACLSMLLGVLAIVALGFVGAAPRAFALTNCTVADPTFDQVESDVVTLINQFRAQQGVQPQLSVSSNLNRASVWLANDFVAHNYLSHTDTAGRSFDTRLANCDVPLPNGTAAAENIAAGQGTAQQVFDAWANSPDHRANMLGAYKQIGLAHSFGSATQYGW